MTKKPATPDYAKMFQDMMGKFPVDMSAFEEAFRNQAQMGEKFSKVALEAAEKSAEISTRWTRDMLARVGEVTAAKDDAAAYSKAVTDFASAQAETVAENMAAFAEIAKSVQTETVELMMAASKDLGAEASAAMKKVTEEMAKAGKGGKSGKSDK
ncbi:MAG: Phasin [Rhodobacterales bacterium]|nr:MAG: Phasin [Rhodobacterales bacterium]